MNGVTKNSKWVSVTTGLEKIDFHPLDTAIRFPLTMFRSRFSAARWYFTTHVVRGRHNILQEGCEIFIVQLNQ